MKDKIYIPIKCSDELPDKKWDGIIITSPDDMGIQMFHGTLYELKDGHSWLKEIPLPTEEEIGDLILDSEIEHGVNGGYETIAAMAILNLLKHKR